MKPWIREATRSSDDEVARMNPALPDTVNEGVRLDTASTDDEANALMRRLRQLEPEGVRAGMGLWRPALIGGGLVFAGVAAAASVAVLPAVMAADAFVDAPTPTALSLQVGETHTLNADITVAGLGELSVDRLHDRGADVSLLEGLASFEVDPAGTARQLVVMAGDVQVEVKGTVFSVQRLGDEVEVEVDRGEVAVSWGDASFSLTAGQSWSRGEGVASAVPVDVQPLTVADRVAGQGELAPVASQVVAAGSADPVSAQSVVRQSPEPAAAVAPAGVSGQADAEEIAPSSTQPGPCDIDAFSIECARSRVRRQATPPGTLYANMKRAMERVDSNPRVASELVEEANQFLDKHGDTTYADDVRAFRVQAAFYGARSSQTIGFADAFLASASAAHPRRADVERLRRVASFRINAVDAAQRDCAEADPMLAELARLETGSRRNEALARRGLCAHEVGDSDKAKRILSEVQAATLPVSLKGRVRDAWAQLVPAPRER